MRGHPIKTTAFPFFWIRFASPKAGALRLGCDKLWLAPRLSWPSLRSGFFQGARAFGFGIDRMAMLKYFIPDIKLLYEGDARFLKDRALVVDGGFSAGKLIHQRLPAGM